jgi:hypothetical protein
VIIMRRISMLVGLAVALAQPAAGQEGFSLSLGGGVTVPVSDLNTTTATGWHALAGLGWSSYMQPLGVRAEGMYHRLPGDPGLANQDVASAGVAASYRLPMTDSPLSPYLSGGLGAYRLDCSGTACSSSTRFGWNAGLGTRIAALGAKWFVEARYHSVNVSVGSYRFVPVTLGLTF